MPVVSAALGLGTIIAGAASTAGTVAAGYAAGGAAALVGGGLGGVGPGLIGAAGGWGAVAKGALGAYSLYNGIQGAEQAAQFADQQAGAVNDSFDIQKQQYREYLNTYLPLERQAAALARTGIPADYAAERAGNEVQQQMGQVYEAQNREMARYGGDPTSGAMTSQRADISRIAGLAEAGARTNARERTEAENFRRKLAILKIGRGIPDNAANGMLDASRQFGSLADSEANASGNIAEGISALGPILGSILQKRTPPAPITTGGGTGFYPGTKVAAGIPTGKPLTIGGSNPYLPAWAPVPSSKYPKMTLGKPKI